MSQTEIRYDAVVLGAGPSGAAAALELAGQGLSVLLIDENEAAGGQVWRAPPSEFSLAYPAPGDELRERLAKSAVSFRPGHRVWSVENEGEGFQLHTHTDDGVAQIQADHLIVAAGARERIIPIEGWTLPGVIGLAAATVLIKSQKILPGEKTVVAGAGPLLYLVANMILEAGGSLAAVVDAQSPSAWLTQLPALMTRPRLAAKGAFWMARIAASGVPIHSQSRVTAVMGAGQAEAVTIEQLDGRGQVRLGQSGAILSCDAVCLGEGLTPSIEVSRLLGARHEYRPEDGGWVVASDDAGRTSIQGLYVCGDGAGIRGVDAAPLRGRAAALALVADRAQDRRLTAQADLVAAQAIKAGRFGKAMSILAASAPSAYAQISPETVVCRCEGVTRQQIDKVMACGALSLNQIKSETRCGMGPCGARFCSEATSALLALKQGVGLGEVPLAASRPPLRPVPLSAIAADFDYEDLPIPAPAPL